ncbi:MAG: hypothetical protein C4523_08660 [Myxococcales bacterium]|nr:MAG: hypothetical protein C4523_08660 [Myxococcales bacterium]
MFDLGCECISAPPGEDFSGRPFGKDCTGQTACPASARAICLPFSETCAVVGSFMDEPVRAWCDFLAGCCDYLNICDSFNAENCVAEYKKDDYALAAFQWEFIQALPLAHTCEAYFTGPGVNYKDWQTKVCE